MPTNSRRTLVVEDHSIFAEMLRDRLDGAGYNVVDVAPTGAAALAAAKRHKLDLVLCDVSLPDADGVAVARELHAAYPHVKVVMLSGDNSGDLVLAAKRAGACGYVSKGAPGGMRELLECIDDAISGSSDMTADRGTFRKLLAGTDEPVPSLREQEVLRHLLEGKLSSNREIAAAMQVTLSTVKTHLEHLFAKFSVASRAQLVTRATELGWRRRLLREP